MRGLAWSVSHVLSCQSLVESYERGKSKCKRRELVACGVIRREPPRASPSAVAASDFQTTLRSQSTDNRDLFQSPCTLYGRRGIRGVPRWDRIIGWLIITPSVGEGVLIIIYILTIRFICACACTCTCACRGYQRTSR